MEAPCRAATWSLGEDKGLKARVLLMSWWTRRDMTPEELNETPDDKIQELVAHFVLRRDVGGHEPIEEALVTGSTDFTSATVRRVNEFAHSRALQRAGFKPLVPSGKTLRGDVGGGL
ncbi:hypothetical protein AB1Y20_019095 [Prymnesium parvum]|uniref:Uncharacterized protein n=1 Tax=Prymnesium parvum TaxID=97485 RepID=A0AB34JTC5_PRYPA